VNNSVGTVTNIFDIILGNTNVSNQGTFIMINLTVINSSSSSGINISNVEISDPNGLLIALNVTNGSIIINRIVPETTILPMIKFINGTVIDRSIKTGIPGVIVYTNTGHSNLTNATGFYSFAFTEGTYELTAKFDP
jgi:hypothetical protein